MFRRIMCRITLLTAVMLFVVSPISAGEAHLYIAPYMFASEFTGNAQVTGGTTGTSFDLEDTLGVDPDERIRGIDAFVKFLGNRLEFSHVSGDYDGSSTLSSDLIFDGTTFSASEMLGSDIEFQRTKFLYGYDFGLKIVNVGFVVGAHVVEIDARIVSSSGVSERESLRVPVPVVGATVGIHPIAKLAIHAEVNGMSVTISDIDATLIDGFVGIDYLFFARFGLTAGYKYFLLDATEEDENNSIDFEQSGLYAGLVLHL